MALDDDQTSVDLQPVYPRLEYGGPTPPTMFSPETERAVRTLCWTLTAVIWFGIGLTCLVLVLLLVGIFGTSSPHVPLD